METSVKEGITKSIYPGHQDIKDSVIAVHGISYKPNTINVGKLKRKSDLKEFLLNYPDRFICLDKSTFLFIDKKEKKLYAYMSESYKSQIIRDFKKNKQLTYFSAIPLLLGKTEEEYSAETTLFDVDEYTEVDNEVLSLAKIKSKEIIKTYGKYIESIAIITRSFSNNDHPKIRCYELSNHLEIVSIDDWSNYIPVNYDKFTQDIEHNNQFSNDTNDEPLVKIKRKQYKQE